MSGPLEVIDWFARAIDVSENVATSEISRTTNRRVFNDLYTLASSLVSAAIASRSRASLDCSPALPDSESAHDPYTPGLQGRIWVDDLNPHPAASEVRHRWPEARLALHHRTGRLEIGETSVVIAVSAPHRRAAFEACEWAIRELKRTVPIWKKEVFADGEGWVEGEGASPATL